MKHETPFTITQISQHLRTLFTGKLAESTYGSEQDRESNFLSRALAALALVQLAQCTPDEAAASVVDGSNDGGIDAAYVSAGGVVWLVQAKFHRNGQGEPDLAGTLKFQRGVELILQGDFDQFADNSHWQRVRPQLEVAMNSSLVGVRALLVYTGMQLASPDRHNLMRELTHRYAPANDGYFEANFYNLTSVHDWCSGADEAPGVAEVRLTIHQPGWVQRPYETVYGQIAVADLAALAHSYGDQLVEANIRTYRGDTAVNIQITQTLGDEPEHFFYLNNGLTAYCNRLEIDNRDRGRIELKRVRAIGLSIVNGAQTLGTIAAYAKMYPEAQLMGSVFIKLISLERCEDERTFAERITRSSNFQNQIGERDFAALDAQQVEIAATLALSGIGYHFKLGAATPPPDATNFSIDEATTACACLAHRADRDLCARIVADRASLWSFDALDDAAVSRYARVFPPGLKPHTVWRAVQVQRLVADLLVVFPGPISTAESMWIVLSVIFKHHAPHKGETLALTSTQINEIGTLTFVYAAQLMKACHDAGLIEEMDTGGWRWQQEPATVFGDTQISNRLWQTIIAQPPILDEGYHP